MVGHNWTKLLDFGNDPDLAPDPGFFGRNFTIAILAMVKASWVRQRYENTQASGPQIGRIKGCLGGGLR